MRPMICFIALTALTAVTALPLPTTNGPQDPNLPSGPKTPPDDFPDLGPKLSDEFFDNIDGLTISQKVYIKNKAYPRLYSYQQHLLSKSSQRPYPPELVEQRRKWIQSQLDKLIQESRERAIEKEKKQNARGKAYGRTLKRVEQELEAQQELLNAVTTHICVTRDKVSEAMADLDECNRAVRRIVQRIEALRKEIEDVRGTGSKTAGKETKSKSKDENPDRFSLEAVPPVQQATRFIQDPRKSLAQGVDRVIQNAAELGLRIPGAIRNVDSGPRISGKPPPSFQPRPLVWR